MAVMPCGRAFGEYGIHSRQKQQTAVAARAGLIFIKISLPLLSALF